MRKALPIVLFPAVSLLVAASCQAFSDTDADSGAVGLGLELKTDLAGPGRGNQFVSISAEADWKLVITADEGESPDWVWLTTFDDESSNNACLEGSGDSGTNILHWAANNGTAPRSCKLALSSGGATVRRSFTQEGREEVIVTPLVIHSDPVGGWMEIPEFRGDPGTYFIHHSMTSGKKTTRNYSFCWDVDALVSRWVAYPLNEALIGSGGRTNEWGLDPKLPRGCQPVLLSGYKGGYDRGHQIPSNDRLAYSANVATFYGTNMTPQIGREFNQSNWAALEGRIHSWSMASGIDTLYVVTGCLTEDSIGIAYDNEGKSVTVPGAYYKAILAFGGVRPGSQAYMKEFSGTGYYNSIAFFYEHRPYSSSDEPSMHAISVNELERLTGENFFPRLSDEYEETVEERSDFSWWNKLK